MVLPFPQINFQREKRSFLRKATKLYQMILNCVKFALLLKFLSIVATLKIPNMFNHIPRTNNTVSLLT